MNLLDIEVFKAKFENWCRGKRIAWEGVGNRELVFARWGCLRTDGISFVDTDDCGVGVNFDQFDEGNHEKWIIVGDVEEATTSKGWGHGQGVESEEVEPETPKKEPRKQVLKKGNILIEAYALINGERNDDYGTFSENVAKFKKIHEGITGKELSEMDVYAMFLALKLCRGNNDNFTEDTLKDLAGYIGLIHDELYKEKSNEEK